MFKNTVITDIKELFTVTSLSGRFEQIHGRKHFGLSFCTDGQITYEHNGNKIVSDKNHAVILPEGKSYTICGNKTGIFPVINFTCQKPICDTIVSVPIQNTSAYIKDFERLKQLSLFDGNKPEMMSIFYHMLHRINSQNPDCKTILPAIKYIEENYPNPSLSNYELANQCNISEVYFRRIFSEHYGMTPKQFIIDIRINKAKQLLSEGALKINAIASLCGFSNQYHFCRAFKEKTGRTPTEYMAQNKNHKI